MLKGMREPGLLASALLAVVVHALFFAFLYFGVSWQPKPQEPLVAELWKELPAVRPQPAKATEIPARPPAPPPPPPPPPKPQPAPPPAAKPAPKAPARADIEL